MASRAEIEDKVLKVIREVKNKKDLKIDFSNTLVEDLGFDSIDFATLVMTLEDEFESTIEDEQSEVIAKVDATVKEVIDFIEQHLESA